MAARILRPSNLHTISRAFGCTRIPQYSQAPRNIHSSLRTFSTSYRKNTPDTMSDTLVQAAQARRTIYQLGKNSPVPDSKVEELVNAAILNVPSSFNTQSTRLVVVLREEHEKLWDIAIEAFGGLVASGAVPEEMFKSQTLPKLQGFKAAYGTVLFYEDPAHIKPFQEKFAIYADKFEPWAEHSNAMHQYFRMLTPVPRFGLFINKIQSGLPSSPSASAQTCSTTTP
jgi:Predicted oxidoreductase related to nitroreductase